MQFQRQPKQLYLLFFTELWERFGYMCLQTVFVLYLSHAFHFSDNSSYLLLGAFGAFQWLTPMPGGYLADKFLGFQRAIIIGGVILALGYLACAMPSQAWFLVGLSILVLGNGLFKPNVSSIVGTLYEPADPRRDSGFTLFYMGINLGTLIPPLFLGSLVAHWGWSWGFIIAALGMVISLATFMLGKKSLGQRGRLPADSILNTLRGRRQFNRVFIVGILVIGALCFFALEVPKQLNYIMLVATVFIAFYMVKVTWALEQKQRNNMLVCITLTLISIGFWAIYMQCFSSFMLFADRNVNLHLFGFHITAEFTQTYNSFFIIALSPLLSFMWPWLARKKLNPSYPTKFAFGTLFMSLGLLQLAFCVKNFSPSGLTSNYWLVLSYCLQTIGELVLSPVGLAMITALSPPKYVGMMMGVWFLGIAAANAMGGMLATISDVPAHSSLFQSQAIYAHAFFDYGWIALGVTAVAFLLISPLKKRVTQ